jgi:hypothetical protein
MASLGGGCLLAPSEKADCPVIPVLLPGASEEPDLPVFLAEMGRIDFRKLDPDPLQQLIRGITMKPTDNFEA